MPAETQIIGAAAALAVVVATGTLLAAKRSGISVRALLVSLVVPLLAPNFGKEGAMERAIRRDRATGPGRPAKRLLKHFDFREEGQGSDQCFRLSVKDGGRPLRLLYLHGGAYILNVQPMQWAVATGLLARLGGEIIAPNYPLAPEHDWREGLEAVERAYLSLARENGAGNVVIFGDSAGGGLALVLAQRLRDRGQEMPAALVLFSPWLDISVSGLDQPALETRDPALSIDFLRKAGELWANGLPPTDPRVSPLFGNHQGLPPTMIFSGTRDILDSDALRLARINPTVHHRHYQNMMHVWPCAPIPEARKALDEAAQFIDRACECSSRNA